MKNQIVVFERAIQMLGTTIGMAEEVCSEEAEKNVRTAFVIRHGRNIHQLAEDFLSLGSCGRLGSIYLFARPALESLFKLAAAVSNPGFAAEKVVGELLEKKEKLIQWREHSGSEYKAALDDCIRICWHPAVFPHRHWRGLAPRIRTLSPARFCQSGSLRGGPGRETNVSWHVLWRGGVS